MSANLVGTSSSTLEILVGLLSQTSDAFGAETSAPSNWDSQFLVDTNATTTINIETVTVSCPQGCGYGSDLLRYLLLIQELQDGYDSADGRTTADATSTDNEASNLDATAESTTDGAIVDAVFVSTYAHMTKAEMSTVAVNDVRTAFSA